MTEKATNGKSRGNGPIAITFVDANGKQSKRPSETATKLHVLDKTSGKHKIFDLENLPDSVKWPLLVGMTAKRVETYARNAHKNKPGSNVLESADFVIENLMKGQIFSRGDGTGAVKEAAFDYDLWREVMTVAAKLKGKELNDKQLNGFEAGLRALAPKARRADVKARCEDLSVATALKRVQAKRAEYAFKKQGGGEYDAFSDL